MKTSPCLHQMFASFHSMWPKEIQLFELLCTEDGWENTTKSNISQEIHPTGILTIQPRWGFLLLGGDLGKLDPNDSSLLVLLLAYLPNVWWNLPVWNLTDFPKIIFVSRLDNPGGGGSWKQHTGGRWNTQTCSSGKTRLCQLYLQRAPLQSEVGGKHLSSGKWSSGVMGVLPGAVVQARSRCK